MPFRTDNYAFGAYLSISPENFYSQVWNDAQNYIGENRDKWLDEIIAEINRVFFKAVAEFNSAPQAI